MKTISKETYLKCTCFKMRSRSILKNSLKYQLFANLWELNKKTFNRFHKKSGISISNLSLAFFVKKRSHKEALIFPATNAHSQQTRKINCLVSGELWRVGLQTFRNDVDNMVSILLLSTWVRKVLRQYHFLFETTFLIKT